MITRKCAVDNIWVPWTQPVLTSNTSFGTITVSRAHGTYYGYHALDGIKTGKISNVVSWVTGDDYMTGWWKWVLPYEIKISQIKFYNIPSGSNNYTKNARFYADGNKTMPLTDAFVAEGSSWGLSTLPVDDVETNTIYFDATSSYNKYVGIGELEITAKVKVGDI